MLLDLQAKTTVQDELDFGDEATQTERRHEKLMRALDAVNERYGRGTLKLGSALVECREEPAQRGWVMKQERRSPRYTTRWGELLVVV